MRAVLTGRLLERGETLLIKLEMVDTNDGAHLWGEQYTREMSDILTLEQEISREISEELRLKLTSAQKKNVAKCCTENSRGISALSEGPVSLEQTHRGRNREEHRVLRAGDLDRREIRAGVCGIGGRLQPDGELQRPAACDAVFAREGDCAEGAEPGRQARGSARGARGRQALARV